MKGFKFTPLHAAGLIFWIAGAVSYFFSGCSLFMFSFWLASLIVVGGSLALHNIDSKINIPFIRIDFYALLGLLLIFTPAYFIASYNIPWQINSDELIVMGYAKYLTDRFFNPFSESHYFGFPNFAFILLGSLAKLFGGITLDTIRKAQAFLGLFSVLCSYFLFRQMLSRGWAFGASLLLGSNHAFLAVSRMGIWTHTAIFVELPALAVLFSGLRHRSLLRTFLGGCVAGLSLYVYFAGRATFVIWFLFLALAPLILHRKISFYEATKFAFVSLIGFIFVATPMLIEAMKPDSKSLSYSREQIILFPEAQQEVFKLSDKKTVAEAIRQNIFRGLTAFNSKIIDHGCVYANFGHGFVDPLTGVLIWFGLVFVMIKLFFRLRGNEGDLLSCIGFLFVWLFMSLLVTRAPNYTRLMILLPFVAYLCVVAIKTISYFINGFLIRLTPRLSFIGRKVLPVIIIASVVFWNFSIYQDFIKEGLLHGDTLGGTYRYMISKQNLPKYNFYLSDGKDYQYYYWDAWKTKGRFMENGLSYNQKFKFFEPEEVVPALSSLEKPFSLFMSEKLWKKVQDKITQFYPHLTLNKMKNDGSRLAIEVF